MNLQFNRLLTWSGLCATMLATAAFGQDGAMLKVSIPFSFIAAGKALPVGTYSFTKQKSGSIALSSSDGKINMNLPVVTSLARSGPNDDHLLAFDKVRDQRILSEVWLPRREGALVFLEKEEHEHQLIKLVPEKRGR